MSINPNIREIPFHHVKDGELVGHGAYGSVLKVKLSKHLIYRDNNSSNSTTNTLIEVAVKNFIFDMEPEERLMKSFQTECNLLRHVTFGNSEKQKC